MAQLSPEEEQDKQVAMWKVKKMIKLLTAAKGNGTSMISLVIPPKDQISRVSKMLSDEYGTASNIKSRVNRLSVLGAITSTQQRLKLYTKVPPNGLVLYCGTVVSDEGKEKRMNIDFEPFKPINTSLYLCDNKFHTEALNELVEDDDKFGFIIMDGPPAPTPLPPPDTRPHTQPHTPPPQRRPATAPPRPPPLTAPRPVPERADAAASPPPRPSAGR